MSKLSGMRFLGEAMSFLKDTKRFKNLDEAIGALRSRLMNKYGRDAMREINGYITRYENKLKDYFKVPEAPKQTPKLKGFEDKSTRQAQKPTQPSRFAGVQKLSTALVPTQPPKQGRAVGVDDLATQKKILDQRGITSSQKLLPDKNVVYTENPTPWEAPAKKINIIDGSKLSEPQKNVLKKMYANGATDNDLANMLFRDTGNMSDALRKSLSKEDFNAIKSLKLLMKNGGKAVTEAMPWIKTVGKTAGKVAPAVSAVLDIPDVVSVFRDPNANWYNKAQAVTGLGLDVVGTALLGTPFGLPTIGGGLALGSASHKPNAFSGSGVDLKTNTVKPLTPEEEARIIAKQQQQQNIPSTQPVQTSSVPQASSTLPPAPKDSIEDLILRETNNNPVIYDYTTGQQIGVANNGNNNGDGGLRPPTDNLQPQGGGDGSTMDMAINSYGTVTADNGSVTGASTSPSTFTYVPYQSTIDYTLTPQEQALIDDATSYSRNVSQADIYNALQNQIQMRNQTITQNDPRYQGGMVQASEYYVDPKEYERLSAIDRSANMYSRAFGQGDISNRAQDYLNRQQQQYQIQIANQAGVPYQDYVNAMLDRQKQQIEATQNAIEADLKFQINQTNDMKTRMELAQQIIKSRYDAQKAIEVANANAFGNIQKQQLENIGSANVANINQLGGLKKQIMANKGAVDVANITGDAGIEREGIKYNNPYYQLNAMGNFAGNFGYLNPQQQRGFIQSMSPQLQNAMFGTQYTPEQIDQMFGFNNPQMMNQQNQQTNFQKMMQFIREGGKQRNLQANEQ